MKIPSNRILVGLLCAAMPGAFGSLGAQQLPDIGYRSVGRAAPIPDDINSRPQVGASRQRDGTFIGSAPAGQTPAGIKPLARDLFTTTGLLRRPRAVERSAVLPLQQPSLPSKRCGSGLAADAVDKNPPASAPWGHCDRDYPRKSIVSPYPFRTAQAHYEALLEETRKRGGPRVQTSATLPDEWNGVYRQPRFSPRNDNWITMRHMQVPTVLSLLTDEYRQRLVQEAYHHGHTNKPMWPSQYCWPEGFLRRWHEWAAYDRQVMVTPQLVQIYMSGAHELRHQIHVGRAFKMDGPVPRLGEQVPRWYGETIGFWDHDTLITWTSNIQAWTSHTAFEHSGKMQSIEIYTPLHDARGQFTGLSHEAILYDPRRWWNPSASSSAWTSGPTSPMPK